MSDKKKVCLVVGAGESTGGSVAKRFAKEGYAAVVTRRNGDQLGSLVAEIEAEGGEAHPFGVDARKEDEMVALFETVERDIGEIEVVLFNVGANVRFPFHEMEVRKFTKVWELACLAGMITCREAAKVMLPRKRGTILVTGASASVKGYANGAAFGSAKHALRGMTQSLAREMWPNNIHVAHFVIDGAIDTEFIKTTFPDWYARKDDDGILNPEHIAEMYWQVHCQPRTAWTFEMDLRPWMETF